MASLVYMLKAGFRRGSLERLFRERFSGVIAEDKLVALKLHMGESFNPRFIKPNYAGEIASAVIALGGKPFLTDTTTLYRRGRFNACDYLHTAWKNGFKFEYTKAPVVIADGLKGEHGVKVKAGGLLEDVEVAQAVYEADILVSLAHCTGHISFGYGGALKNLGMGCVTKNGKRRVHGYGVPVVDAGKCIGCGACAGVCPYEVISVGRHARLNGVFCVSCGRCIQACPQSALSHPEGWMEQYTQALIESAHAVVKTFQDRVCYINFLLDIAEGCDCAPKSGLITGDLGVLASRDVVAVEQASLDLIRREKKDFAPEADLQIKHAVGRRMGGRKYKIVELN